MVIYSHNELEELRAFMQPVSPSVRIAQQFRNEDTSGDASGDGQQQQQQSAPDPFEGIDLDNLPDDVRDKVVAAKTQFATLQSDAAATKAKADALDAKARAFQSRADQAQALLQKHGLDPNQQQQQRQSPEQQLETQLFEQYKAAGIDEPTAKAWAKMQAISGPVIQKGILQEVGSAVAPHLQNVGLLTVDRMLEHASQTPEYGDYLQNHKVYNSVQGYLRTLSSSGSQITNETIDTTIKMVVGELAMKGESLMPQQQQFNQRQPQFIQGGSRSSFSAGLHGHHQLPTNQRQDGPRAANDETARAIQAVTQSMRMGMKSTKR